MTYCTSPIYTTVMIINIITPSLPGKRLIVLRRTSQGCENMPFDMNRVNINSE